MDGFFRVKALLMEANERFGAQGTLIVALAGAMVTKAREVLADAEADLRLPIPTREECYRYLCDLPDRDPEAWATMIQAWRRERGEL